MLSYRAFFLASLLLASCAASRNEPAGPWRVEVATEGGLTGRGVGAFAIASDGAIEVRTMQETVCRYTASEDELRRFRELVAQARPDAWAASYVPEERCCDRIQYTLTLESGRKTTTQWIDQPLPMPADLAALAEAMVGGPQSLRVTHGARCQPEAR